MKTIKETKDMNRNRPFRIAIIVALVASILCLSLAYASFNTLLQINSTAAIEPSRWNIVFQNLQGIQLTDNAIENSAPVFSATNIKLDVKLFNPGDAISYTFDVKNTGNIDAKLSTAPAISGIPASLQNDVIVTLKYVDGTSLNANDQLPKGVAKTLKLTITFAPTSLLSTTTTLNITNTLLYVQV